jgi:hypothetical protein
MPSTDFSLQSSKRTRNCKSPRQVRNACDIHAKFSEPTDSNFESEKPYDVFPAKQIQTMLSTDQALRRELSEIRTLGNAIDGFNKETVVSL